MGGASSGVGEIALPAGGGAMPTQTGYGSPVMGDTYRAPWAGYAAQYQQPALMQQQAAGPAPGGGLLSGSKAPQGDNEQAWIDAHIDEIVKAAEWKKPAANKFTSLGYYNTGPSGGGYAARDTWGGDVYKDSKGKYYWDKEGKLAIPDDVRLRLIGLTK